MNDYLGNLDGKNADLFQKILGLCLEEGGYSLAEMSKELNISIPTITKLVQDLIEYG